MKKSFQKLAEAEKAFRDAPRPKQLISSSHGENVAGDYFLETGDDMGIVRTWETLLAEEA